MKDVTKTKGEVIKYSNDMNTIKYVKFTKVDFDLFMAVCSQVKNRNDCVVELSFDYIMDLINWNKTMSLDRFVHKIDQLSEKLGSLKVVQRDRSGFRKFQIFPTFFGNKDNKTLTVRVNPDLTYFLNDLKSNFTSMDLKEYVDLPSKYTKQIYSQIKQRYHLRDHFWQVSLNEFRELLIIPSSYEPKFIQQKILSPALKSLRTCKGLEGLKLTTLKESLPGAPVKGYRFEWTTVEEKLTQIQNPDCETNASLDGTRVIPDSVDTIFVDMDGRECLEYDFR